jgi:hypothetical protein
MAGVAAFVMSVARSSVRFARPQEGSVKLDTPAGYLHLGFILISYPNLIVIGGMIVLFAIALVAPFHGVGGGGDRS